MLNKYYIRKATWMLLLTASIAWAGGPEYLGLTLNINTKSEVEKKLNQRNAVFNSNYGYRGYSNDLPVIKLISDPLLNKQGDTKEAWLYFSPDKKLYKMSVTWRDPGDTYSVIKDVFDAKYQLQKNAGRGFVRKHVYQDKNTEIVLTRNSFGFGNDQLTSVDYIYIPKVDEVKKMKSRIDVHIKAKNVKDKGINL